MTVRVIILAEDHVSGERHQSTPLQWFGPQVEVLVADSHERAVELALGEHVDLVLIQSQASDEDGLGALHSLRAASPEVPVMLIVGRIPAALKLQWLTETGFAVLRRETIDCDANHATRSFDGMIGDSRVMLELFDRICRAAALDVPVLVQGETGTGKELVAKSIHKRSLRSSGPFVDVNCAAISPALFESLLFGHERGAFTGADRSQPGLFEQANRGTIFLDEVADLPADQQAKLLRAVADRAVWRVGGQRRIPVDVNIVAATKTSLSQAVHRGTFREDLYYRLASVRLFVPPLQERRGDIPLLIGHILDRLNTRYANSVSLSREASEMLAAYSWPGNVRQLEATLLEGVIAACGGEIRPSHLTLDVTSGAQASGVEAVGLPVVSLPQALEAESRRHEERWIRNALAKAGGNQTEAAKLLQIDPRTLYTKMRKYAVSHHDTTAGGLTHG